MARTNLIRAVFYVLILIALLHVSAVAFFFYWTYWWFDIPMHFLGGVAVGLFSLWIFGFDGGKRRPLSSGRALLIALVGSLAFGLAWEYFEYANGITFNTIGNYPLDTIKDLLVDVCGGYVSHLYFLARGYNQ